MSFVEKLSAEASGNISLVIVPKTNGKTAWYFIDVHASKLNHFRKEVFKGPVDLSEYGVVIHCGWDEYPPQPVIDEMINDYGFRSE